MSIVQTHPIFSTAKKNAGKPGKQENSLIK